MNNFKHLLEHQKRRDIEKFVAKSKIKFPNVDMKISAGRSHAEFIVPTGLDDVKKVMVWLEKDGWTRQRTGPENMFALGDRKMIYRKKYGQSKNRHEGTLIFLRWKSRKHEVV